MKYAISTEYLSGQRLLSEIDVISHRALSVLSFLYGHSFCAHGLNSKDEQSVILFSIQHIDYAYRC